MLNIKLFIKHNIYIYYTVSLITGLGNGLEQLNGLWNGQWDVQLVAPYAHCVLDSFVLFYSFRCQKSLLYQR